MRLASNVLKLNGVVARVLLVLCAVRAVHAADAKPAAVDKAASDEAPAESEAPEALDPSATGVPIEVASKSQKEIAFKQFKLGIDLLDAGRYAEALDMLRMSHQRVASPNTRLMMARCLGKLERFPDAYAELELALAEARALARGASKYDDTVTAVQAELAAVRAKVAIVKLDLGIEVTGRGQRIEPGRWGQPLVLPAGETVFELRLANGQTQRTAVQLSGGQELKLPLMLDAVESSHAPAQPQTVRSTLNTQPIPSDGVSRTTLGWVGVGIAGAGAAGFAAFGLLDRARYKQLSDKCANDVCPASLRGDAETGRTYQSLANVGIGVSAVGVLTAAYFFLTAGAADAKAKPARESALLAPTHSAFAFRSNASFDANTPYLVLGTHSVTLNGRF